MNLWTRGQHSLYLRVESAEGLSQLAQIAFDRPRFDIPARFANAGNKVDFATIAHRVVDDDVAVWPPPLRAIVNRRASDQRRWKSCAVGNTAGELWWLLALGD